MDFRFINDCLKTYEDDKFPTETSNIQVRQCDLFLSYIIYQKDFSFSCD